MFYEAEKNIILAVPFFTNVKGMNSVPDLNPAKRKV